MVYDSNEDNRIRQSLEAFGSTPLPQKIERTPQGPQLVEVPYEPDVARRLANAQATLVDSGKFQAKEWDPQTGKNRWKDSVRGLVNKAIGGLIMIPTEKKLTPEQEQESAKPLSQKLAERESELLALLHKNENASEAVRNPIKLELKFVRVQRCCTPNKLKGMEPGVLKWQIARLNSILEGARESHPSLVPEVTAALEELNMVTPTIASSSDLARRRGV